MAHPVGLATLSPFPGYTGPTVASGIILIEQFSNSISLSGFIHSTQSQEHPTGAGLHVHYVTNIGAPSCEAAIVGGHYYAGDTDVWLAAPQYTPDDTGSVDFQFGEMEGFSLDTGDEDTLRVEGYAIVAHDAVGDKVACGMITLHPGLSVTNYEPIPEYSGDLMARGMAVFEAPVTTPTGLSGLGVRVVAAGVGGQSQVKAHVHSGKECEAPGGHLFGGEEDYWGDVNIPVIGSVGSDVFYMIDDFTNDGAGGALDIQGRVSVLHDEDGTKIGCGKLVYVGFTAADSDEVSGLGLTGHIVTGMSFGVLICVVLFFAYIWLERKGAAGRGEEEENVLEMLQRNTEDTAGVNQV